MATIWSRLDDLRRGGRADEVEPALPDELTPPVGAAVRGTRSKLGGKLLLGHPVRHYSDGRRRVAESGRLLTADTDSHAVTIAPPGSGKATAVVIPQLLNWTGSVVVLDPKGELAWATAEYRRRHLGQEVFIVDPWRLVERNFYGPLNERFPGRFARDETVLACGCNLLGGLDVDEPDFDVLAADLAVGLCPDTPGGNARFFDLSSQDLVQSLITAVCAGLVMGKSKDGKINRYGQDMNSLRRALLLSGDDFHGIVERAAERHEHLGMQLDRYKEKRNSMQDVFATAASSLKFLNDRTLMEFAQAGSGRRELDWSVFGDETRQASVYVVLPAFAFATAGPWLRCFLQRVIRECQRVIRKNKILLLLDEIGSIGRVENLAQAFSAGRGAGLCCWGMWQYLGQIRKDYGDLASGFEGASTVLQVFGTADVETAEYVAKKIGREHQRRISETKTFSKSKDGSSSSTAYAESWTYEAAMDGAEVEMLAQSVMLNFLRDRTRLGRLFLSGPADYFATPFFNGFYRPMPNKPEHGPAQERVEMELGEFLAWRRGHLA